MKGREEEVGRAEKEAERRGNEKDTEGMCPAPLLNKPYSLGRPGTFLRVE